MGYWAKPTPSTLRAVLATAPTATARGNTVLLVELPIALVITRSLFFLSNFFTFVFMWCLLRHDHQLWCSHLNHHITTGDLLLYITLKGSTAHSTGKTSTNTNSNKNNVQDRRLLFSFPLHLISPPSIAEDHFSCSAPHHQWCWHDCFLGWPTANYLGSTKQINFYNAKARALRKETFPWSDLQPTNNNIIHLQWVAAQGHE